MSYSQAKKPSSFIYGEIKRQYLDDLLGIDTCSNELYNLVDDQRYFHSMLI